MWETRRKGSSSRLRQGMGIKMRNRDVTTITTRERRERGKEEKKSS
jgi:hypothetical protein